MPSNLFRQVYSSHYFALHVNQRISVFNVFVVVSVAVSAGMAAALQLPGYNFAGGLHGLLLCIVSLVFWKLDRRTAPLINQAEAIFIDLADTAPSDLNVFVRQTITEQEMRPKRTILTRAWSYSECFGLVFTFTSIIGLAGLLFAFSKL